MEEKEALKKFNSLKNNYEAILRNTDNLVATFGDLPQIVSLIIFRETLEDLGKLFFNKKNIRGTLSEVASSFGLDFEDVSCLQNTSSLADMSNYEVVRMYKLFVVASGLYLGVPKNIVSEFAKQHDDRFEDIDFGAVCDAVENDKAERKNAGIEK